MTTTTSQHGFMVYSRAPGQVSLSITQFASDEYGDLQITSDFRAILSESEVERLIKELQGRD